MISAVVIVAAVVVYLLFFASPGREVLVQHDKVVRETLSRQVSATGTINPLQTVEVGTQVSGTVARLYVDFNDQVKAGQVIARMDTRNLIALVRESEANLLRAEVQMNQSKRALDRATELYESQAIPLVEFETAKDNHELAKATYNSARLQLERNQVNLDYATIRSPIDGIIVSRRVDEGQTVAASFTTPSLYTIANDLKKMKIEASVDEADIGQVRKGQQVIFTVDAFPGDTFTGVVEQVQLEPVTVQNVVTYTVVVAINNDKLLLMPGMTATLQIIVASRENVLTIPNGVFGFVMDDDLGRQLDKEGYNVVFAGDTGQTTVWKLEQLTLREIPVTTGYSNGIKTEISGPLSEGDQVVNGIEINARSRNKGSQNLFMPRSPRGNEDEKEENTGK